MAVDLIRLPQWEKIQVYRESFDYDSVHEDAEKDRLPVPL